MDNMENLSPKNLNDFDDCAKAIYNATYPQFASDVGGGVEVTMNRFFPENGI